MMERVASRPIDDSDIGIRLSFAVEIELCSWLKQHVGDPRHRDRRVHPSSPLRKRSCRDAVEVVADAMFGGVPKPDSTAW